MPDDSKGRTTNERVRRGAARTLANYVVLFASVAVLGLWAYFGVYQLDPGEHAVILSLGRYSRTVSDPGLKWHLPPPLESHDILRADLIEREEFGFRTREGSPTDEEKLEGVIQTKDNNVAHIGFVVQYRIKDAFFARYRIADPVAALRDTAQAAIREVVGRTSIDGVLSEQRTAVQDETRELLQEILDRYESGVLVDRVELQEVQPPLEVQDAFDDVIAALQDRSRAINEAEGYANEILPRARAQATELREAARAYRDAKIATAEGDAGRFTALLAEYRRAPDVTRKRLYLETMEEVLPGVEKVIIEPGTANVLPYLPLGRVPGGAAGATR